MVRDNRIKSELFHNLQPNHSGLISFTTDRPIVGTIISMNVIPGSTIANGNLTLSESGTGIQLTKLTGVSGTNSFNYPKVQSVDSDGADISGTAYDNFVTNKPLILNGSGLGSPSTLQLVEITYI